MGTASKDAFGNLAVICMCKSYIRVNPASLSSNYNCFGMEKVSCRERGINW